MSAPRKIRFGILGTGLIVRRYAEARQIANDFELVAIASRDADRARATAATYHITRAHAGYEALLADPDVDAVINALHNGLHCEWTIRALQAGKHVLCEKPLACTAAEAEQMFAAARASQRWLMEAFMFRFHPQMPLIIQRICDGELGRLLHINSHRMARGRDPANPRYNKEAGGGALLDVGCYSVNFARAITGTEPIRATASAHFDETSGVDLTLTGTLDFPGHTTAQFCCSFESEPSFGAEIVGTEGRIIIPHPWMPPVWPTEFTIVRGGKSEVVRVQPTDVPQHSVAPFALELSHFASCIRDNRAPTYPPGKNAEHDALENARVNEALMMAAQSGKPVELRVTTR